MDFHYDHSVLYVTITNDITIDTISILERRLFQMVEDYGMNQIMITILGRNNTHLLNHFKKNFYHYYKGYLFIY